MRISKKIAAIVLSVLMAVSMMPFTALADEVTGGGAGGMGGPGSGPSIGEITGGGGSVTGAPGTAGNGVPTFPALNSVVALDNPDAGRYYYISLEDALADAQEGAVITLVKDIDTTVNHNGRFEFYYYDISGVTIDLNDHTLTESTYSIAFIGVNGTIKNGTIDCVPDSDGRYYFAIGCDMDANPMQTTDNIVLEDLTVNAGLHVSQCTNVVAKDCDVTGRNYYAIWGDPAGTITVDGGNYSSVDGKALFGTLSAPYDDSYINVKSGNFSVPNGKKLVIEPGSAYIAPQNVTVKGGFYHYDNGNVYEVLERNLAANCTQDMTTGEVVQDAPNNGTNITVAETISENFYIDEDYYKAQNGGNDVYVSITYNHNSNVSETADMQTEVMNLKNLPAYADASSTYDGARMLSVLQAPAQSTEDITVKVYNSQADATADANVVGEPIEYSVYKYCKNIIDSSTDTKLVDLAESTLDYAAAAQNYFEYNQGNMATKDNGDFYNSVDSADLSGVAGFTAAPSCLEYATMVVKSDLEINLLSKTPITVTGASIDADAASTTRFDATSYQNDDYYVVHVTGIEAANMDNTITVNTDLGEISFTANTIMKIFAGGDDANLATLAKAMYLYGAAANAYFA